MGELRPGERLLSATGHEAKVVESRVEERIATVYNFEVGEWHTYFAEGVWAHNVKRGVRTRIVYVVKDKGKGKVVYVGRASMKGKHHPDRVLDKRFKSDHAVKAKGYGRNNAAVVSVHKNYRSMRGGEQAYYSFYKGKGQKLLNKQTPIGSRVPKGKARGYNREFANDATAVKPK